MKNLIIAGVVVLVIAGTGAYFYLSQKPAETPQEEIVVEDTSMSFFVTSANPGKGADLGGLKGADAYCTKLAEAAGVTGKSWRAYLSSYFTDDTPAVSARDRIGAGPWYNAKGELIAQDIASLHSDGNNLNKNTALTEKGEVVSGRGDDVNMHDILTGSASDGTLFEDAKQVDTTCKDWTSGTTGSAVVGHHDRVGLNDSALMKSWNSSHFTRGCSMEDLKGTGGGGLFYCFAE
jgi:hypothetical protein